MIKIQADNIDDHFAELDLMRQNGWKELAAHVGLIGQQLQFQVIEHHLYSTKYQIIHPPHNQNTPGPHPSIHHYNQNYRFSLKLNFELMVLGHFK